MSKKIVEIAKTEVRKLTNEEEIQKNIKECNTGIVFSDVTNLQNLILYLDFRLSSLRKKALQGID